MNIALALLIPASLFGSFFHSVRTIRTFEPVAYNAIDYHGEQKPGERVYDYAMRGYASLHSAGSFGDRDILTIIDFTLPSTEKRMWVIDLNKRELLYHSLVAHGRKTGELYATNFSNVPESHQSSLGFYITGDTYTGKNGFSLKLHGAEPGINDNAEARAIVMHSAPYVSEEFIRHNGRLGRSYGCPAIPIADHKKLIESISGGTCLYIYYNSDTYLSKSELLATAR